MIHGILAIQGDYYAHGRVYDKLGLKYIYIKTPRELEQVDSLIIPGGESTTVSKLSRSIGMWEDLKKFNRPVLGTCTGIILMAGKIENPPEKGLGLLDITILRNAYGSQINSFTDTGHYLPDNREIEMVFIRAPKIKDIGDGVEIIAELKGEPVGVRQGKRIGLAFHPELSDYDIFHELLTGL